PGRSPPINGTDPIHASEPPFPHHGCAITNFGRGTSESTTFPAIAICSAPASRARTWEIPKNKGRFLALVGTQAWGLCAQRGFSPLFLQSMSAEKNSAWRTDWKSVFCLCPVEKRRIPQKRVHE